MYRFDAYFNGDQVYINKKRQYTSNEVMTQLLNMDFGDLEETRRLLMRYQYRLKLEFDMNLTDVRHYEGWVRSAQRQMHRLDALAQSMALYADTLSPELLSGDKLVDTLNTGSRFFASGDDDFGIRYGDGYYLTHFVPDVPDAPYDEDTTLAMEQLNQNITVVFQRYLDFVDNLIQVQSVYAYFLDKHINAKSKYLNEHELAKAYSAFMDKQHTPFRSRNIDMGHAVLQDEQGRDILCEVYHFESLGAFLYIDLFKGLAHRCIPKRCHNCGRWFLLRGGKYADYCDRPLDNDAAKTCRDIGARKRYIDKCNNDPVWQIYNRAYKQHYARYMKKQMTVAEFERWSAWAVEIRERAERGEVELEEYRRRIRA